MLRFSDYTTSNEFGKAIHNSFIYDYFVSVDFEYTDKLNAEDFVKALFNCSSDIQVYMRILENIDLNNCTIVTFNILLNQVTTVLKQCLDSKSLDKIRSSVDKFIERNKPISIMDLNCINYKIIGVLNGEKHNISDFYVEGDSIYLCKGNNSFNYQLLWFVPHEKEVYFDDGTKVKSYEVDNIDRIMYLYC